MQETFSLEDDFCGSPPASLENNDTWLNQSQGAGAVLGMTRTTGWWQFVIAGANAIAEVTTVGNCFGIPDSGTLRVKFHITRDPNAPVQLGASFVAGLNGINVNGAQGLLFVNNGTGTWFVRVVEAGVPQPDVDTGVPISSDCTDPDVLEILATASNVRFRINGGTMHTIVTSPDMATATFNILLSMFAAATQQNQQMEIDLVCATAPRFCRDAAGILL